MRLLPTRGLLSDPVREGRRKRVGRQGAQPGDRGAALGLPVLRLGIIEEAPLQGLDQQQRVRVGYGAARRVATEALAQGLSWEELELALFEQALADQRGNLSAAARQLGITRRALEYRVGRSGRGERAAPGTALDPDTGAAT